MAKYPLKRIAIESTAKSLGIKHNYKKINKIRLKSFLLLILKEYFFKFCYFKLKYNKFVNSFTKSKLKLFNNENFIL